MYEHYHLKIPCVHNLMEMIVVVVVVDLFQFALVWWVYVASFPLGGNDNYDIEYLVLKLVVKHDRIHKLCSLDNH